MQVELFEFEYSRLECGESGARESLESRYSRLDYLSASVLPGYEFEYGEPGVASFDLQKWRGRPTVLRSTFSLGEEFYSHSHSRE